MFTLRYTSPTEYQIYEEANSRFVAPNYPEYTKFISHGGKPTIQLDGPLVPYMQVKNDVVSFVDNYETLMLADKKTQAMETLYQNRLNKDYGGTVIGGIPIYTDRESQALLANAYLAAKNGLLEDGTDWKVGVGTYATITKEQIMALYEGVLAFIKQNYSDEKAKVLAVNACTTLAELEAIDLSL